MQHASNGTAVLHVDHHEWSALAFGAIDIDLDILLNASGTKIRGAKGLKPVYLVPGGLELRRKVLVSKELRLSNRRRGSS